METRPLTVAVDVDEVLAQLHAEWLRRYNLRANDTVQPDDVRCWGISKYAPKMDRAEFFAILREPDFYDHVVPFLYARDGVYSLLSAGHRVLYVTAGHPETMAPKFRWLQRWGFLPQDDDTAVRSFFPVKEKSLIRADVLIDDAAHNLREFPGWTVRVIRPHNEDVPTICNHAVHSLRYISSVITAIARSRRP